MILKMGMYGHNYITLRMLLNWAMELSAIFAKVIRNVTSNVHLSFINALQRFISRHGKVIILRSDNGKTFVGAKGELQRSIQD